jgi:hypothetical protein
MTYQYAVGPNTGDGFITHEDREAFYIAGYPGNVWLVEDNAASVAWIARNALVNASRAAAQALVDAACVGQVDPSGNPVVPPVLP